MDQNEVSPLRKIADTCQQVFQLSEEDSLVFEFIISVIVATAYKRLGEPVWSYMIGPPGSCKTESIKPYMGFGHCLFLSSLTENWLMSGYRDEDGEDPSLMSALDGKVLIVKDISSLINLPPRTVNKIWGDLRDAFDQTASKASGVSGLSEYTARFGAIMLGTGAVDLFAEEHQQLGERFLAFRLHKIPMVLEQRQGLAMHVSKSMKNKEEWQAELKHVVQETAKGLIKEVIEKRTIPTIPEDTTYNVMMMGNLLSLLRTTPVKGVAESPELPTRVGQQLLNIGSAHALADGRDYWNESDIKLVRRLTVDTLPIFRARLVQSLWERGPYRPFTPINRIMERCKTTRKGMIQNVLSQYIFSNVVESDETGESFRLSQEIYNALNQVNIF